MRTNPTEAEAKMWNALRDRKLMGVKFKRQVPFDNYIVDFLRADHKRVVEIDGPQHAESQDIILSHASSCIFSPQDTGYTKHGGANNSQMPNIIEMMPKTTLKMDG